LIIAMVIEPSGPITVRNACGRTIRRSTSACEKPSDRPASRCPRLTAATPERSASVMYADV
jgi:hypothetical protein